MISLGYDGVGVRDAELNIGKHQAVSEMYIRGDVVVITCEHPEGATEYVYGRPGVVINVTEDDGDIFYDVKDITGSEYAYDESELRDADWEEIKDAFVELVKCM